MKKNMLVKASIGAMAFLIVIQCYDCAASDKSVGAQAISMRRSTSTPDLVATGSPFYGFVHAVPTLDDARIGIQDLRYLLNEAGSMFGRQYPYLYFTRAMTASGKIMHYIKNELEVHKWEKARISRCYTNVAYNARLIGDEYERKITNGYWEIIAIREEMERIVLSWTEYDKEHVD
ncbi:MAG: hypothetical protein LBJ92_02265 [Holosporales bacterium]|jgi:hypothetical protein|nr:hypothetical protein [Holosporales bacterium]